MKNLCLIINDVIKSSFLEQIHKKISQLRRKLSKKSASSIQLMSYLTSYLFRNVTYVNLNKNILCFII